MRLVTVGCSGSFAGPSSPASCYLVQVPATTSPDGRAWNVLLDLGNGGLGALQRVIDPLDLDAVLLSHLHPDHFVDVCGLYVYLRYHPTGGTERHGGRAPLPVFGPRDTAERASMAYAGRPGEDMGAQFDFRRLRDTEPITVGPLTIEPRRVYHPVEAFGFRVTGPSTERPGETAVLTFTGDTDYCDAVVDLARGADLLLSEAAFHEGRDADVDPGIHMTGQDAGRLARTADVSSLVLTHVPAWNDLDLTLAEAAGEYSGPTVIASTGATFSV
ncbi:Ribonuclease BN, tRNA processing enzyme [Paraoerskovia marina]|uniref:Ribonuclease BN, tRNA processing enzyme n=1 Tax=Paraoerskovia marina TaxID=545619 RepID=A0A1H1UDS4_9CELL|nr:MBL fold metallo-hydrolase [Paraoerskovia marina]SDS70637.1 Ribonuclease BN, tRNA processing enzyme [Paraoerskovia marina]